MGVCVTIQRPYFKNVNERQTRRVLSDGILLSVFDRRLRTQYALVMQVFDVWW